VNGVHYHFTTKAEMEEMVGRGEFVEYANVHGNMYGTSRKAIQDVATKGKVCVLDIDVQVGVTSIRVGCSWVGSACSTSTST